jgi:hypothetical protein
VDPLGYTVAAEMRGGKLAMARGDTAALQTSRRKMMAHGQLRRLELLLVGQNEVQGESRASCERN